MRFVLRSYELSTVLVLMRNFCIISKSLEAKEVRIGTLWFEWRGILFCSKVSLFQVTAVKRLCVARLPPYLTIQLKRFDFDWERDLPQKYNDYFEFPLDLDMMPFTAYGLALAEGVYCKEIFLIEIIGKLLYKVSWKRSKILKQLRIIYEVYCCR